MSLLKSAAIAALLAAVGAAGCGSSSTESSNVSFTEKFSGKLDPGTFSYGPDAVTVNHYTVHQVGDISVFITNIAPDNTLTVGLGLGVYDAATNKCSLQLTSNSAKVNVVLSAVVNTPGEYCVGVYDVGTLIDTQAYDLSITHT